MRDSGGDTACDKIHFQLIIQSHTDISMVCERSIAACMHALLQHCSTIVDGTVQGDCSYLDTCKHMKTCKFVHYKLDSDEKLRDSSATNVTDSLGSSEWLNCDARHFDFSILGKFDVIMLDPPWDIHMEVAHTNKSAPSCSDIDSSVVVHGGCVCSCRTEPCLMTRCAT
jgi:mRNA m6A methyltransferase catalytic subunit